MDSFQCLSLIGCHVWYFLILSSAIPGPGLVGRLYTYPYLLSGIFLLLISIHYSVKVYLIHGLNFSDTEADSEQMWRCWGGTIFWRDAHPLIIITIWLLMKKYRILCHKFRFPWLTGLNRLEFQSTECFRRWFSSNIHNHQFLV